MRFDVEPLRERHMGAALHLLRASYERERLQCSLLPAWSQRRGGGADDVERQRLSQAAAMCDELSYATNPALSDVIFSSLYREMAHRWVEEGRRLHTIGHLHHDEQLRRNLFHLGFGAILQERLRDLACVVDAPAVAIIEDPELTDLVDVQTEHARYYRTSPIFLRKDDRPDTQLSELREATEAGDRLFAIEEQGMMQGLFIVGPSAQQGEGLLLRQTNSAQVKSAYLRPCVRGRGLGRALLRRCVEWAREHGYERLLVEHETANIAGSAFWTQHFNPYLTYSMRYVDDTL